MIKAFIERGEQLIRRKSYGKERDECNLKQRLFRTFHHPTPPTKNKMGTLDMTEAGLSKFRLSLHASQTAHQAGAYLGFLSRKRLRVFLLPPGWDASPLQGYPSALNLLVPIYTPGWTEAL